MSPKLRHLVVKEVVDSGLVLLPMGVAAGGDDAGNVITVFTHVREPLRQRHMLSWSIMRC